MIWIISLLLFGWVAVSMWLWLKHHTTFVFGGVRFLDLTLLGMLLYGPGFLVINIFLGCLSLLDRLNKHMRKP